MKTTNRLLIILFSFVILSSLAYATSHLPIGLLKIMEYNQGIAQDFLQNISFDFFENNDLTEGFTK